MEDPGLFMQWAMDALQQAHTAAALPFVDGHGEAAFPSLQALREASQAAEMVQELNGGGPHAAAGWSSGDGDSSSFPNVSGPSPMSRRGSSATMAEPGTWDFGAATRSLPEMAHGSPPARRASSFRGVGSMYAQDHVMAERKRREKINQRFVELSTVIPGLKKMDKATILSDATRYVKELQEKVKELEDGNGNDDQSMAIESWVLVKKPCVAVAGGDSSPSAAQPPPPERKPLPEIEARFSEKSMMVRIHSEGGKGVVARVLAEVEKLHLSIIHANVAPFTACTLLITIMAKIEEGRLTVTADEIVGRLNSALLHQHSSCNSAEETGN